MEISEKEFDNIICWVHGQCDNICDFIETLDLEFELSDELLIKALRTQYDDEYIQETLEEMGLTDYINLDSVEKKPETNGVPMEIMSLSNIVKGERA